MKAMIPAGVRKAMAGAAMAAAAMLAATAPSGLVAQGKGGGAPPEPAVQNPKAVAAAARAQAHVPVQIAEAPAATPDNIWNLDLSTGGRVQIQLRPDMAPLSVERIKLLTRQGFYSGLKFHRVIEGFMAQGGDPKGDGTGGSTLPDLKAEFNALPSVRGVVALARAQLPDSANSQFFIVFAPNFRLIDGKYTVFGRVLSGMQWVDGITRGEPPETPSTIVQASIEADHKPQPSPEAFAAAAAAAARPASAGVIGAPASLRAPASISSTPAAPKPAGRAPIAPKTASPRRR